MIKSYLGATTALQVKRKRLKVFLTSKKSSLSCSWMRKSSKLRTALNRLKWTFQRIFIFAVLFLKWLS